VVLCEILSIREQRTARLYASQEFSYIKAQPKNKSYSWIEIIKHDKPGDCWIVIAGEVYDVSKFVDKHPG
jgi:cytochrome b involved in lipid metabolism